MAQDLYDLYDIKFKQTGSESARINPLYVLEYADLFISKLNKSHKDVSTRITSYFNPKTII